MRLELFIAIILGVHWAQASQVKPLGITCRDGVEEVPAQVVNADSYYSESPVVHEQSLYHVEYSQDRVMRVRDGRVDEFWKGTGCGPSAVTPYHGGFLVACYSSHQLVFLSDHGELLRIWQTPPAVSPAITPNDFVADAWGGLYFTSSGIFNADPLTPVEGRVYYLGPDGAITEVASGIHYSNGIALSSSGDTLWVSEHLENRILKYTVLGPGVLDPSQSVFADLSVLFPWERSGDDPMASPYLGPDGFRVSQGIVFVAQYAGSRILKLNEAGQRVGVITFKSSFPNTTNVWADGNRLYVTAVRDDSELGVKSVNPAIVVRIDDPRLRERSDLVCEIK